MKFIYFDVGGVLVKDFSKTSKWMELLRELKIPVTKWPKLSREYDLLEREVLSGKRENKEIEDRLSKEYGARFEGKNLVDLMVEKFEKNEGIWRIVEDRSKKCEVGLLTNMYPGMLDLIKTRGLLPDVEWKVEIDSSVVGQRKNDMEIYEIAEKASKAKVEEILFIDNTKENLIPAKKRGWQVWQYNSADYEGSNRELENFLR